MNRILTLVLVSLLVPLVAKADPQTADDWYKEGATQYNLGNFEKAVDAFKQGFAVEPDENKKPAYLYNIAQAYRQENKCKDAVFFYKRFLALSTHIKASTRDRVNKLIQEGEQCVQQQDALARQPPQNTLHPDDAKGEGAGAGDTGTGTGTGTGAGATAGTAGGGTTAGSGTAAGTGAGSGANNQVATRDDGDGDGDDVDVGTPAVTKSVTTPPKLISARFIGGAAKISAGSLEFPIEPTFTLIAGYPLHVADKLELDVGAAVAFTPVPWTNSITNAKKSATFLSALADVGATYEVAPKIGVRADAGVGALVFGGIAEMGNPFTEGGAPTSGALTMPAVRAGLSADYAITPNLTATVAPITFTYSPPKSGLRGDIKSITRLDFMLGVGYRM